MPGTGNSTAAAKRCPPIPENNEKPLMRLVIDFQTDKVDIDPEYFGKIREISDIMKKNPNVSARVEGVADYTGQLDYNVTLSRVRVINIKSQILHYGDIDPARISINDYGCSTPAAGDKTIEGSGNNRRGAVVLTLTNTGPAVTK